MSESQVKLVDPKRFTINLPSVGECVAVGTQGNEIVVEVRLGFRPGDNMMNLDIGMSTGGDSAPVTGLD